MKKAFLYVLGILFTLSSCSKADGFNDSIFEEYGITIPYKKASDSETDHLLKALIDNLDENQIYLFYFFSSDTNYPSVTKFNEYMRNNKETVAFFEKDDCVPVLISACLNSLKTNRYKAVDGGWTLENQWFYFLYYILTNEICMSKMNITEKVQLMVLSLEKLKYGFSKVSDNDSNWTSTNYIDYTIMISIMLSSNYTPFVNNVKPLLRESMTGATYCLWSYDGTPIVGDHFIDLITKYAKQFINDNK